MIEGAPDQVQHDDKNEKRNQRQQIRRRSGEKWVVRRRPVRNPLGEIRRWEVEAQKFVRVLAEFKLIRIDDGAVLWERRVQRAVPTPSATNVGQASTDAVREIVHDLFAG